MMATIITLFINVCTVQASYKSSDLHEILNELSGIVVPVDCMCIEGLRGKHFESNQCDLLCVCVSTLCCNTGYRGGDIQAQHTHCGTL